MKAREFLSAVLPDDGYLIAATPFLPPGATKSLWQHIVVDDIPALLNQCGIWVQAEKDVFYALSSFAERQVWNPNKVNWRTQQKGAFERRTQANVKFVKSLWIDLDVGEKKTYTTQADGFVALKEFCMATSLPRPLVTNSGHGLHVYWPFDQQMARDAWQPIADKLRDATLAFGLKCDTQCTADAARVLRVPGSRNFKQGSPGKPVQVEMAAGPYPVALLDATLTQYLTGANVPLPARKTRTVIAGVPTPFPGVESNLTTSGPPLSADTLVWECANFARQVANRGATAREPEWYMALGLAQFTADPRMVALSVSDAHPGFDAAYMDQKRAQWTGPPTCKNFHDASDDNEAVCKACRHWGKIKSPATIGRELQEAPAPDAQTKALIPALPKPYQRIVQKNGQAAIVIVSENDEGVPREHVICPFEIYPQRVLREQTEDDTIEESTIWVAKLPRLGDVEIKLPQGILSDTRKLHYSLLQQGAYLNANHAKTTSELMHIYLQELARTADRERMFDRLGWHDEHQQFVAPTAVYTREGKVLPHAPSKAIHLLTKGMKPTGSMRKWLDAIEQMYGGPGNEHNRIMCAFAFGAPLLHMTGQKGMLVTASGDTGRGKTTTLETGASIFGEPDTLIIGGGQQGSTINAMFGTLGMFHSYPVFWDDTTEREPEEMRRLMLHISTGRDKLRMNGHEHDGHNRTWGTVVISSANTDEVHRILATGKDSSPHLMRLISVDFSAVDTSAAAKIKADRFRQLLRENHGHAGGLYLQEITKNYEMIQKRVQQTMERFDVEEDVAPSERFWSAGMAVALVGTHFAYKHELWPFDPFADLDWDRRHITKMRVNQTQSVASSVDILNEFLDNNIGHSLILQAKGTSNLDNVANRPYQELWIRREMDNELIYISREALTRYCNEVKANFGAMQAELMAFGIVLRPSCLKTLGADTQYAAGQVRCWEISMVKLQAHRRK